MATESKPNGKIAKDKKEEFFDLYSEALEESIRSDIEYWIEVQRKALLTTIG